MIAAKMGRDDISKPGTAHRGGSRSPASAPQAKPTLLPRVTTPPRNGALNPAPSMANASSSSDKPPDPIQFQQWFKSVNPLRTYAAQVQRARNGNSYLVLTEGKRDKATGELRKTRLFLYGEDFESFTKLIESTLTYLRAHPLEAKFRAKRQKFWAAKTDKPAEQGRLAPPGGGR
jgi:hypothetical protein